MKNKIVRVLLLTFALSLIPFSTKITANNNVKNVYQERKILFQQIESITNVPWYLLAAIDQYERTIHKDKKDAFIAIQIPSSSWSGLLNPNPEDENLTSIQIFDGIGLDGDGDGRASRNNPFDILYSIASYLSSHGTTMDDLRIGLWEYYQQDKTVKIISEVAQVIQHFDTIDLHKKAFPIPKGHRYTYYSTWGDKRGWGGNRIHEGTDIFAPYGTPVVSTCFGYVEVMGWNRYGGWRIGIRDINNIYHYFAHLSGFNKQIKVGSIVKPGQVIGYVGSSGYGNPGTSGKFPPHLHYGMYKYNGKTEWAFDPYPYLRQWQRLKN